MRIWTLHPCLDSPSWRASIHKGAKAAEARRSAEVELQRRLRKDRAVDGTICVHVRSVEDRLGHKLACLVTCVRTIGRNHTGLVVIIASDGRISLLRACLYRPRQPSFQRQLYRASI